MNSTPGLIKFMGCNNVDQRVYNKQAMDFIFSFILDSIDEKVGKIVPIKINKDWVIIKPMIVDNDPSGTKRFVGSEWMIEHNIWPVIWVPPSKDWEVRKPMIVDPNPKLSQAYIGSKWIIDHNVFPAKEPTYSGSEFEVRKPMISPRDPFESKSFLGKKWIIEINLFQTIKQRFGGTKYKILPIIVDRDLEILTSGKGDLYKIWSNVKKNLFVTRQKIDGGDYWEPSTDPLLESYDPNPPQLPQDIRSIACAEGIIIATVEDNTDTIYKSIDRGKTFEAITLSEPGLWTVKYCGNRFIMVAFNSNKTARSLTLDEKEDELEEE